MSIKRKLATSLATAGLLAGIFGSALAPVAQAATVKGSYLRDELRNNFGGGYNDYTYHSGSATDPYIMYAPMTNDGTSTDPIGWSDDPICFQADESYLATTGNVPLHADGDEVPVKVTATNGLGIFFYDTADYSSGVYESQESYWTTGSKTLDDVYDGISLCLAPLDDDDAYTSTVTITVRGQVAWTFTVVVVGPATAMAPVSLIGSWVAESNDYIGYAAVLSFTDKAGKSLRTYLGTIGDNVDWFDDMLDFAKTGYTSDYGNNDLVVYVDDTSIGDSESDQAVVNGRFIDLAQGFCGEMNEVKTVMASINIDDSVDGSSNATLTAPDMNSAKWTYKCSANGSEAVWTSFAFDAASVEQGESVPAHFMTDDGYGHPQGIGSSFYQGFYCEEVGDSDLGHMEDGDSTCGLLLPVELMASDSYYQHILGASISYDDGNDGVCNDSDQEYPIAYDDEDHAMSLVDGKLGLCYRASSLNTGVASAVFHAYDSTQGDGDPITLRAAISVLPFGQHSGVTGLFGTTIKVGKRTVSITGPVGAKVTFVVEDAKMNVKTYYRVVGADGKAALRFRVKGYFKVTALLGDLISNTAYISPKF